MLLSQRIAVIYGGGGALGAAIARAFAREGAQVYLTGRHRAPLEAVAAEIAAVGGRAEVAELDALNEPAIEAHLQHIVSQNGRIDISVNAIGVTNPDLGVSLVDLPWERFLPLLSTYVQSYFLTARLAARKMIAQHGGVILTVSALPARLGSPQLGGYSAAMAAKEALIRALSCEVAPHGVRVVGVRPHAIPETSTMQEVYRRKMAGTMSWEQWQQAMAGRTHTRRLTTLAEFANAAAFLASDLATGLTGTTLNLTMGNLDD